MIRIRSIQPILTPSPIRLLRLTLVGALLAAPAGAQSPGEVLRFPWPAGRPAPAIEGVAAGDSLAQVTAALGAADVSMEIGEEGLRVHLYRQGRVKVAVSPRGVESIFAQWPERAVVDGVSLRASALRAFDRWGEPMRLERETGAAVWVGASRRDSMSTSSRGVSIPGAGDDQRGPLRPRERCQPR